MHPWLLHVPPLSTYGVCMLTGIIAAWLLARHQARRAGLEVSRIDLLMPVVIAAGLCGAAIFGRWTDVLTGESQHAAVLFGALVAGTLAGIAYAKRSRIPMGILGDICAAPAALMIASGRAGCFFAGCCYGKPWSNLFSVRFPPGSPAFSDQLAQGLIAADSAASLPVFPVQLLEATLCALLAALVLHATRRIVAGRRLPGEAFLFFAIAYSVIRFFLEFLRADNPPLLRLTFSQWTATATIPVAFLTLVVRRRYQTRWHIRMNEPCNGAPGARFGSAADFGQRPLIEPGV